MLGPLSRVLVGSWLLLGCSSEPHGGTGIGPPGHGGAPTSGASSGGALASGASPGRGGGLGAGGAGRSGTGTSSNGTSGNGTGAAGSVGVGAGGAATAVAGGTGNLGGSAGASAGTGTSDTGGEGGAGADRMCLSSNIDLTAPAVSGKITVNGVPINDMNEAVGSLAFSNAAGDYAPLGALPGSSYSALVAAGTYDLYYSGNSGTNLPILGSVKLRSGVTVGKSPLSLDVDIATTAVAANVTLNGGTIPGGSSGDAFLELRRGTDERMWLASVTSGAQSAVAVPGTYDVYYSVYSREPGGIPTNTSAKIQSGVVIGGSRASLEIDIPSTPVSASVTVAGAPITGAIPGVTFLTLKNDDGDTAELTVTSAAGASSALVIPGTYDVYYGAYGESCVPRVDCTDADAFAPNVPKNASVKVKSGVVVGTAPVSLAIDLPATRVAGMVSVNGDAASGLDGAGLLTLTSDAGDSVELSPDATGAYSELVLPGTYDLVYRINGNPPVSGQSALPANFATALRSGIVVGTSPLTLDIDIPVATVAGSVTLNGSTVPPAGKSDGDGWVGLSNSDGAWVALGSLRGGPFSVLVIPGTYDLAYAATNDGMGDIVKGVPINSYTTFERAVVVGASALNLAVDVPAVTVAGAVTANGVAVTDLKGGAGILTLVDASGNKTLFADLPTSTADASAAATGAYSELVIPGSYELYYEDYFTGASVPGNEHADLGCFEVR